MIEVFGKILAFLPAREQSNIRKSMVLGFFTPSSTCSRSRPSMWWSWALVDGSTSATPAWQALALLLVSILGRAIMNRFSQLQQTHAGYFMVANKRLHMGDKLKRIPMGYFNDQSLRGTHRHRHYHSGRGGERRGHGVGHDPGRTHQFRRHAAVCPVLGLAHWPAGLGWNGAVPAAPLLHGKNSPLKSPPSASGTRPGWWRRCWSSSRA